MVSPDQWEEIMGLDWDRKLSEDDTSYYRALEAAIYIAHRQVSPVLNPSLSD
jgi:hypothetical protein